MSHYDLIVIGSGPAGRRAAVQAAKLKKTVLCVDRGRRVGGVCVHTGTIPSKTLRETVLNLTGWRERGFYGRGYRVKDRITADDLMQRLTKTLDHEVELLEHQFTRNKVEIARGAAKFTDANSIEIDCGEGEILKASADKFILAIGTRPYRPDDIPFDDAILDADEILELTRLPRSLTVIGGGVIGIEYATIFSALDVKVTVLEAADGLLKFVDRELIDEFMHDLRDRGVTIRLNAVTTSVSRQGEDACLVELEDGRQVWSEMVLYAAGRQGAVEGLNLEAAGLTSDKRGRLKVNEKVFQTDVPHIYACGDIIGFPSLASTAMEQGRIAARAAFNVQTEAPPEYFPYGIYAVPEISTVGETEEEVRARKEPYECGVARFRETARGHIMGVNSGFMKLIFSLKSRKLLGAHIVGEGATELIHIGQAVITLGGTLEYFVENTFNYPTLAEAYKIAALDAWNRMPRV
ncbi:Si-specific NAD(P)(+) transhydrogenase [Ponticaulis profundi]|uniref:Soluble pyridine nucleotide transhydrogenase n=1 Tax=Ponticaulis profundi TaxID=2665222 RepID=A0ABW1S760_9PROT